MCAAHHLVKAERRPRPEGNVFHGGKPGSRFPVCSVGRPGVTALCGGPIHDGFTQGRVMEAAPRPLPAPGEETERPRLRRHLECLHKRMHVILRRVTPPRWRASAPTALQLSGRRAPPGRSSASGLDRQRLQEPVPLQRCHQTQHLRRRSAGRQILVSLLSFHVLCYLRGPRPLGSTDNSGPTPRFPPQHQEYTHFG